MSNNSPNRLEYTGKKQPKVTIGTEGRPSYECRQGKPLYPYIPDSKLIEAVNLAIYLERPLLLRGEVGCGKTQLAAAVAYELDLPYEEWAIKSTSKAEQGLYRYDAVARLRDAQLAANKFLTPEEKKRLENPENYIVWGPLGRAFREKNSRTVILIDEIDKADIDFPNDLLQELDKPWCFTVEEVVEEVGGKPMRVQAEKPPIVFITCNDEKELSEAFLRRCLFYYIEFPDPQQLIAIVKAHFPQAAEDKVKIIVDQFIQIRKEMKLKKGAMEKKVSTSELLDWFNALNNYRQDPLFNLGDLEQELLYSSVLFKSLDDFSLFADRLKQRNREKNC